MPDEVHKDVERLIALEKELRESQPAREKAAKEALAAQKKARDDALSNWTHLEHDIVKIVHEFDKGHKHNHIHYTKEHSLVGLDDAPTYVIKIVHDKSGSSLTARLSIDGSSNALFDGLWEHQGSGGGTGTTAFSPDKKGIEGMLFYGAEYLLRMIYR